MTFSFHHLKVDYKNGDKWSLMAPDIHKLKEIFASWQEGMVAGGGWNAVFWCNHDQPRIVSRLGDTGKYWKESAKMLAAAIHLMRGTPYIYQGEEIGMTNADSILAFYRELIALRKEHRIIAEGSIRFLARENDDVLAYERELAGEHLLVLCNFRPTDVPMPERPTVGAKAGEKLIGNYPGIKEMLRPYEVVALCYKA